jgi:hypothetical protein
MLVVGFLRRVFTMYTRCFPIAFLSTLAASVFSVSMLVGQPPRMQHSVNEIRHPRNNFAHWTMFRT